MRSRALLLACLLAVSVAALFAADSKAAPAKGAAPAAQPDDAAYSEQIKKFTTAPYFTSELVDHLPASKLPTPEKVLGHIVGAANYLTYPPDIYRYLRELEKASPRVKVFTIGTTEEGHEMVMVAVSDEANLRRLDEFKGNMARLSDPRSTPQAEADRLIAQTIPSTGLPVPSTRPRPARRRC